MYVSMLAVHIYSLQLTSSVSNVFLSKSFFVCSYNSNLEPFQSASKLRKSVVFLAVPTWKPISLTIDQSSLIVESCSGISFSYYKDSTHLYDYIFSFISRPLLLCAQELPLERDHADFARGVSRFQGPALQLQGEARHAHAV